MGHWAGVRSADFARLDDLGISNKWRCRLYVADLGGKVSRACREQKGKGRAGGRAQLDSLNVRISEVGEAFWAGS